MALATGGLIGTLATTSSVASAVIICTDAPCPPSAGSYSVSNTTATMTKTDWTGSGDLSDNGLSTGSFSFNFVPPTPIDRAHPPNPCAAPPNPWRGTMTIDWAAAPASIIEWDHVFPPQSQDPNLPPQPMRGDGSVVSGSLAGLYAELQWHPPSPWCPGTTESFTGTISFSSSPSS